MDDWELEQGMAALEWTTVCLSYMGFVGVLHRRFTQCHAGVDDNRDRLAGGSKIVLKPAEGFYSRHLHNCITIHDIIVIAYAIF